MEITNFETQALLSALQSGYTTVEVQFCGDRLNDGNETPQGKRYTYKVPLAWNVQPGDWLVVLPGSAFKTVVVQAVHNHPVDTTNARDGVVKWAVQKIDHAFYFNMKAQEEKLQSMISYLKRKREAEMLLAELSRTVGDTNLSEITNGFAALLGTQPQFVQAPQAVQQPTVGAQPVQGVQPQAQQPANLAEQAANIGQTAAQVHAQNVKANAEQAMQPMAAGTPSWAK